VADDADLLRIHPEDVLGERAAHAVDALAADRERESRVLVPLGKAGARLHVIRDEAIVDEFDRRDVAGGGKRLVGRLAVAILMQVDEIGAELGPHERRTVVQRGGQIGLGVGMVEIDVDQFGRILRLAKAFGDDERNGVADIAHLAVAQQRDVAHRMFLAARLFGAGHALDRTEMGDVRGRQDQLDTWCGPGGIERTDGKGASRLRGTQHIGVERPFPFHVVGIAPLALDEGIVLLAQRRCTHSEFRCSDIHETVLLSVIAVAAAAGAAT
jgi:hypothetical protein